MENVVSFPGLGIEVTINNIAFQFSLFGKEFTIYWYGILIATGFALAIVYAMCNAKRYDLNKDKMVDVIIGGTIGAVICARLYFVIFSWSKYKGDFWSIFKIWEGGLAIYGGIIGAFVVGWLMCKWRKVNVLDMFDVASIGFLIGQGIGRWGNFFNQEAYGANTTLPWGMTSAKISSELAASATELSGMGVTVDPSLPVHPCFLYESIWCLLGVLVLHLLSRKRKFKGQIVLSYAIWYGVGRVVIEGLRTDSLMVGSIRVSQLLSAVLIIVAIVLMVIGIRRQKERESRELMMAIDKEAPVPSELIKQLEDIVDMEDSETAEEYAITDSAEYMVKEALDGTEPEEEDLD